jgi:hypothetical protein
LAGGGFSARGTATALSFAFELLCLSNEACGGALLITLAAAAGADVAAVISATASVEITAFLRGSGRGCAQQLEFSARSKALKLLIAIASLVVLNHQTAPLGVSARLKPHRQRRKVQPSIS